MTDIILDIDGTLADNRHRLHLCPKDQTATDDASWEAFMAPELVALDGVILPVWCAVRGLLSGSVQRRVILITGRHERLEYVTRDWIRRESELFGLGSRLAKPLILMRRDGDRRRTADVKRDHLAHVRKLGCNPTIAFEDRLSDARMYRDEGLMVFHVADGDF